jgi:hypothetical protein
VSHLEDFLPYVERSHILGFHGEAMEYLYTADMIQDKLHTLKSILSRAREE